MTVTSRWRLVGVGLILFVPGLFVVWLVKYANAPAGQRLAETSIAVLPFQSIGDDRSGETLAQGIRGVLAGIPGIHVDAQGPMRLEGKVRTSGGRLSITAQLVESPDGSPIWTRSYERRAQDVSTVEEEICRDVVGAMRQHALERRR